MTPIARSAMHQVMRATASRHPQVPYSLHEFADEEELPEADPYMLASIQFRGEQPRIKER